ncbi:hypothetical protein [Polymorphospora lycopeni]|uniref:Uncharacterized protein n=1 Tax=Polymorphospora lycopeni TaxID=3140240 RepID=A0ABV5CL14_9ACTN
MARQLFGGGPADWTFNAVDGVAGVDDLAQLAGGQVITFWNLEIGGTQYEDLTDSAGTPITSVTSSTGADGRSVGQIPPLYGPDGVDRMWAQAGTGPRVLMSAVGGGGGSVDPEQLEDLVSRELYDDKGVLLVGSSFGVPTPVDSGANGQVLTADSAEATGVKWATPTAATGNVLYWTGDDYAPTALKGAVDVPRVFLGPVDPDTVDGVVMPASDWMVSWIGSS